MIIKKEIDFYLVSNVMENFEIIINFINLFLLYICYVLNTIFNLIRLLWGLGIGDWGLGIGDWAQSPIPNPQSPIPNPHILYK